MDNIIDSTASDSNLLIYSLLLVSSENKETINDSENSFIKNHEQQELELSSLLDAKWGLH
jgi:hypothetical protein